MKRLKLFLGLVAALFMAATNSVDAQSFTPSTAPDEQATAWAANTKWYKLKMWNNRYLSLSATTNYGAIQALTTTTVEDGDMRALWCVAGNETGGYRFYNMAAGPNAVLGIIGSGRDARARMYDISQLGSVDVAPVTFFDRKTPDGQSTYDNFVLHGTANNAWNIQNDFLALWDHEDALATNIDGSKVVFEPVDLSSVNIDYAANYTRVLNAVKNSYTVTDTYRFENYTSYTSTLNNTILVPETVENEQRYIAAMNIIQMCNTGIWAINHKSLNEKQYTLKNNGNAMYFYSDGQHALSKNTAGKESVWTLKSVPSTSIGAQYYFYNRLTQKYLGSPDTGNSNAIAMVDLAAAKPCTIYLQNDNRWKITSSAKSSDNYFRDDASGHLTLASGDLGNTKWVAQEALEELQSSVINATIKYDPQDGLEPYVVSDVELTIGNDAKTYAPALDFYSSVSASPATVTSDVTEYTITCAPIKNLLQVRPTTFYLYVNADADNGGIKSKSTVFEALSNGSVFTVKRANADCSLYTIQCIGRNNKYLTASGSTAGSNGLTFEETPTVWTEGTGATSYFQLVKNGNAINIKHPGANQYIGDSDEARLCMSNNANNDASKFTFDNVVTVANGMLTRMQSGEAKEGAVTISTKKQSAITSAISAFEADANATTMSDLANALYPFSTIVSSSKYYQIIANRGDAIMGNYAAYAVANGTVSTEADSRTCVTKLPAEFTNADICSALWQFIPQPNGSVKMKNANTSFHLGNIDNNNLVTTKEEGWGRAYVFTPGESGLWALYDETMTNTANTNNFYLNSIYNPGSNDGKNFTHWNSGVNDAGNLFYIKEVTSIPVTISAVGYATLNLPMAVEKAPGVKAYYGAKDNASTISLAEISRDVIPANTPVILVAENTLSEATQFNFNISYDNPGASPVSNALTGTTCKRKMNVGAPVYVLKNGNSGIGFYRVDSTEDLTLNANKAYYGNATGGASVVRFDFGSTTGIDNTQILNTDDAKLYDLNGRRVLYPTTGVYVKSNGEKVFVK
ncbi:MAG: hypothetical protein SPD56_08095 [Alloprevotella sp.]|nr:hypothetical protein [Alloprevotella sp.]